MGATWGYTFAISLKLSSPSASSPDGRRGQGMSFAARYSEAVETLREIMKTAVANPSARVAAAKAIFEFAMKGIELEDHERRLAEIEETLRDKSEISEPRTDDIDELRNTVARM